MSNEKPTLGPFNLIDFYRDMSVVLDDFDEWEAERKSLSDREGTDDNPRPTEWENNDDVAVDILRRAVAVLRPTDTDATAELITKDQVQEWVGREMSDDDMSRLDDAIPNSSIPDAISTIVASFDD